MFPTLKEAFLQNINKPPKISSPFVVFFATLQILFGFNFGFVKQMNKYKTSAKIFSAMTGTFASGFLCYSVFINSIWLIYAIQYCLTFLILMASNYTVYEFMLDLRLLRIEMQEDFFAKHIESITWIYAFVMFCFKYIFGILFIWNTDQGPFIFRLILLFPILGLDAIPIVNSLVFYHIYDKLKHLCVRFRDNNIGVIEVQRTYKAVLDSLDKIRHSTDHLIVLGFVADCPKWIETTLYFLVLLKHADVKSWATLGCSYAYALHLTVHMCVPAVCAELMQAKADKLALLVHERLLSEPDESTRAKLSQLARYINARPPLRKAWRLLPAGLQQPIAMLSLCATQLIVVIQFTHLYD